MNNCWRATVAIRARSSVCRALQELYFCPQLIPQATTTQTAWLTLTSSYLLWFVISPSFFLRSIPALLSPKKTGHHHASSCCWATLLNFLEASSVSVWLSHFPRKTKKKLRWNKKQKINCAWDQTSEVNDENKQLDPISHTVACLLCILNHLNKELMKWTSVGPGEAEPVLHNQNCG